MTHPTPDSQITQMEHCTICGEPLDEYLDCLESESGKHATPEDERRWRAAIERETERIRIRRAWLLR